MVLSSMEFLAKEAWLEVVGADILVSEEVSSSMDLVSVLEDLSDEVESRFRRPISKKGVFQLQVQYRGRVR